MYLLTMGWSLPHTSLAMTPEQSCNQWRKFIPKICKSRAMVGQGGSQGSSHRIELLPQALQGLWSLRKWRRRAGVCHCQYWQHFLKMVVENRRAGTLRLSGSCLIAYLK